MHEGDRLEQRLHALIRKLEIKKTAANGKKTLVRLIPPGELFAAPAVFGNGISSATIICKMESQVFTIDHCALLYVISQSPEISVSVAKMLN
ncbi:cyclic nucleotide-binding domain-containing protein [Pleurocapsa sp. FMAR1]|uniref:cyclic nucleotide-binding domain-containing protein n=1 Tax=Pleurocapsa sp. FMAR1 TaxID=3040204 RepID=UPI0029C70053|nr:cyclic nucleotide-binding domain-containing protein [Pleurocapsa sp. FMAR1]